LAEARNILRRILVELSYVGSRPPTGMTGIFDYHGIRLYV